MEEQKGKIGNMVILQRQKLNSRKVNTNNSGKGNIKNSGKGNVKNSGKGNKETTRYNNTNHSTNTLQRKNLLNYSILPPPEERYAGPSYMNSPEPSTLPMPSSLIFEKENIRIEKRKEKMNKEFRNRIEIKPTRELKLQNQYDSTVDKTSSYILKEISNIDAVKYFICKYIKECDRFDNISIIILYELSDKYKFTINSLKNLLNSNSFYFDKRIERSLKILILKYSKLFKNKFLPPPSFFT